jgi:hypothetical protein
MKEGFDWGAVDMTKIPNIPVTILGQPVEGIRPIKWADDRDPEIITEKYVRAEVKMPDAATLSKIERLADEAMATGPFTEKEPKPPGYALANLGGETVIATSSDEDIINAIMKCQPNDGCFIYYSFDSDGNAVFCLDDDLP